MDKYYKKEFEEAKKKGASKEWIKITEFLSKGNNVRNEINKCVRELPYDYFMDTKKNKKDIIHCAIMNGISIGFKIHKSILN